MMRIRFLSKTKWVVGVDEVGRGPLAGPVTVAVVCVPKRHFGKVVPKELRDSKKMRPGMRQKWHQFVREKSKEGKIYFSISSVNHRIIDRVGVVKAVKIGIRRVFRRLQINPLECFVLLDGGLLAPKEFTNQKTIIRGDARIPIIALASIVGKVHRDRKMFRLSKKFPNYGFEKHKGYGTKFHLKALKKFGPCEIHRKTFLS